MRECSAILLVFVVVSSFYAVPALAQTPGVEPSATKKTIALNEPAVVLLYEEYTATFSVPSASFQMDNQGNFRFTPGTDVSTLPVQEAFFGSGFIITPDGYIITNAHVATTQEAQYQFLIDTITAELQSQLQKAAFTDQLSQNFENAYFTYLQSNGSFSNEQNTVTAYLPVQSPSGNLTGQPLPAEVKTAGDMIGAGTEKDVAVIKVSADHPLPTVQLGDSDSITPGDNIVIIGYPGISAATQNVQGEESFIPTATAGIVSALKPMPEGWTVIQTDATVQHGNSGGPALDSGGNVIGIATFGGTNPLTGTDLLAGINFLVPINIAKQFLNQISVQNVRGTLDQDWQQGLEYFWGSHYSAAVQEFNSVLSLYPGDPYAIQYIQQANTEINRGNDVPLTNTAATTTSTNTGAPYVASLSGLTGPAEILLAVAVVIVLTWLIVKRRPKRNVASVPNGASPKFCRNCGTSIRRPTRFCPRCGANLNQRQVYRR